MADCGPGQKLMAPDDCRDVAIIDEDGNAQKIKRDHWIVWKLEIDCLHSLIDIGLTSAYTHNGTIVANTATEDNQMVHYRLQNNADVNTGINPYQGALAKVGAELRSGQQFKDAEASGSFGMTPEDARAEISRIRANPALMDKTNPENKVLNDRLTQLYELAHPDQAA